MPRVGPSQPRPGPSQPRPSQSKSQSSSGKETQAESNQLNDAIRFGMKSIVELCKEVLPLCGPEERKEMRKQLDSQFKTLVKADMVYEQSSTVIDNQFIETLDLEEDADDKIILMALDAVKNTCQQKRIALEKKITDSVIKKKKSYKEYNELVTNAVDEMETNDNDDEDTSEADTDEINTDSEQEVSDSEATVTDMIPTIDPISKGPLKDPVRNRICKHIYGKRAMVELIKQTNKIRCPTLGCANNELIKISDLKFDAKLAEKVKLKLKKERRLQRRQQQQ